MILGYARVSTDGQSIYTPPTPRHASPSVSDTFSTQNHSAEPLVRNSRIPLNKSVQKRSANLWPIIYRDIDLSKAIFERLSHGDIHV
jgi:hypothetical protein